MNYSITVISLLGICLLNSCAVFKGKGKNPTKKEKTEKVVKKTDQSLEVPLSDLGPITDGTGEAGNAAGENKPGRTIEGFMEPDVTQLPDNKDLVESLNVAPIPEDLAPKPETPVDIVPLDPSDPTEPLPDNR